MYSNFRLLHFTLRKDLGNIYANIFLKTFALSLISVFVPIYLINEIGISFQSLLVFYIFYFVFLVVGYIVGAIYGHTVGLKRIVILSIPFYLAYYLLLYSLQELAIPLFILGVIIGIGEGFFWISYNTNFARFSDRRHRGEEVNLIYVIASLIGIFGPFVGGALLSFMDFYVLFVIIILLLIFSVFPLLDIDDQKHKNKVTFKSIFNDRNYPHSYRLFLSGIRHDVGAIFWPIFIFLIVVEYFSLGAIISVASMFSSFAVWLIGRKIDKVNKEMVYRYSSVIHGLISIAKTFIRTVMGVFNVAILSMVSYGSAETAFEAIAFNNANKTRNVVSYFIYREIMLSLGRIFLLIVLLFSGLELINNLKLSFILLGVFSIFENFGYKKNF